MTFVSLLAALLLDLYVILPVRGRFDRLLHAYADFVRRQLDGGEHRLGLIAWLAVTIPAVLTVWLLFVPPDVSVMFTAVTGPQTTAEYPVPETLMFPLVKLVSCEIDALLVPSSVRLVAFSVDSNGIVIVPPLVAVSDDWPG